MLGQGHHTPTRHPLREDDLGAGGDGRSGRGRTPGVDGSGGTHRTQLLQHRVNGTEKTEDDEDSDTRPTKVVFQAVLWIRIRMDPELLPGSSNK